MNLESKKAGLDLPFSAEVWRSISRQALRWILLAPADLNMPKPTRESESSEIMMPPHTAVPNPGLSTAQCLHLP